MVTKFIIALLLSCQAFAGLPPTSTKGFTDTSAKTTFEFDIPFTTITHSGTIASINAANHVLPFFTQMVYVNYQNGSDAVCPANPCGDGSWDKPFQTINFALSTISDSSQNKPYVVGMTGDRQVETTNLALKPYVSIVGLGQRATYIRSPGNAITAAGLGTASSWNLLKNFYLGGGTALNWDLQAQAPSGSNNVLILENVTLGSTFTYKGRNAGGGDFLEAYVGVFIGSVALDSVFAQLQSIEIGGAVTVANTQTVTGLSASWNNMTLDSGITCTDAGTQFLNSVNYPGTSGITTVGTNTLDSYRGLPPKSRRTLSGGTTVTNRDDATMVPYTPTTAGDWFTLPTDVSGSLDLLASTGIYKSQTANKVFASPNGSSGTPSFRSLVSTDLPTITSVGTLTSGTWNASTIGVAYGGTGQTTFTDGQLLIGNSSGNTLTKATLTAGSGVSITNGNGSITISSSSATPVMAPPTVQRFTSGSGTYNKNYTFVITSGSATAGATYTNNSVTFTVYATVASATQVVMSGSGAPTSSGTLTKASGTGDATLTFSQVLSPLYLKVKMVGGGGGGGPSGSSGGSGGSNGGDTTFGSSLLTANGGNGGGALSTAAGATGGGFTVNSPALDAGSAIGGSGGGGSQTINAATTYGSQWPGGIGGSSALGGAGGGSYAGQGNGAANTGGGGSGGGVGAVNGAYIGVGGGAGGYVEAILSNPSATYSYSVGGGGAGGTGGASGLSGGSGGSGLVIVEEHYQ